MTIAQVAAVYGLEVDEIARLLHHLTAIGLSLISLVTDGMRGPPQSSQCRWDPTLVNLGHSGPPINQRPSSSARSRRLARSAEAERTKDPPEPRCRHGGARHEQSFDPLKPEAGVARPLVELDPRHAPVPKVYFHGALHSAHTRNPQPGDGALKYGVRARRPCEPVHTRQFFQPAAPNLAISPDGPSLRPDLARRLGPATDNS